MFFINGKLKTLNAVLDHTSATGTFCHIKRWGGGRLTVISGFLNPNVMNIFGQGGDYFVISGRGAIISWKGNLLGWGLSMLCTVYEINSITTTDFFFYAVYRDHKNLSRILPNEQSLAQILFLTNIYLPSLDFAY